MPLAPLVTVAVTLFAIGCTRAQPPPDHIEPPVAQPAPTAEPAAPAPAPCPADDDACRVERLGAVGFGPVRQGLRPEAAIEMFGEPAKRETPWEEGATGEWVSTWDWPARGVSVTFGAPTEGGPQTARDITVRAPFAGKTERGIGVGSTLADVRAAYRDSIAPGGSDTRLVAGSVYGGAFFTFAGGKVTEIFVGAGAE